MGFLRKKLPYIGYRDEDNYEKFQEALIQHPEDKVQIEMHLMSISFSQPHRHEECIQHCDYLIQNLEDDRDAVSFIYYTKGCIFSWREKYEEAIYLFEKSIEFDSENAAPATASIANIYMMQKDYNEALKYLHKLEYVLTDPEEGPEGDIYVDIGEAYFQLNDFENAKKYFKISKEYDEDNSEAIQGLAKVHEAGGNYQQAIRYLQIIPTLPDQPKELLAEIYLSLSDLYRKDKLPAKAAWYQQKFIETFDLPEDL